MGSDDNKYSGAFNSEGARAHSRRAVAIAEMEARTFTPPPRKKRRRGLGFLGRAFLLLVTSGIGISYSLPRIVKGTLGMKESILQAVFTQENLERMMPKDSTGSTKVLTPGLAQSLAQGLTQTALPEEELQATIAPAPPAAHTADEGEINIVAKGNGKEILYVSNGPATAGQCQLRVESSPPGARVKLNDTNFVGVTPVNIRGDCDKPTKVSFDLDNYLPAARTLAFTRNGGDFSVRLHPVPKPKVKKPSSGPIEAMQKGLMNMLNME